MQPGVTENLQRVDAGRVAIATFGRVFHLCRDITAAYVDGAQLVRADAPIDNFVGARRAVGYHLPSRLTTGIGIGQSFWPVSRITLASPSAPASVGIVVGEKIGTIRLVGDWVTRIEQFVVARAEQLLERRDVVLAQGIDKGRDRRVGRRERRLLLFLRRTGCERAEAVTIDDVRATMRRERWFGCSFRPAPVLSALSVLPPWPPPLLRAPCGMLCLPR